MAIRCPIEGNLAQRSCSRRLQMTTSKLRSYSLSDRLHRDLTSRRLPLAYDYLNPRNSHLLSLDLNDIFTRQPSAWNDSTALPSIDSPRHMTPGHHLVYFPPPVTLSQCLPDGTDTLHSPGEPYNRRLWAGGGVKFLTPSGPYLDGSRAVCLETIRDVTVKGPEGDEKVFVRIERRVGIVGESEKDDSTRERLWKEKEDDPGQASIIETRNLVFLREKTPEQLNQDKENFGANSRDIKPPSDSEFRYTLKPNRILLSRFSALTFNAHLIHLDHSYTQNIEGYRNLLVHGPLTLTLLLTALQKQLIHSGYTMKDIEYRNLAPLYVDEELSVCGKRKAGKSSGAWDVWIEGPQGGLAVRSTVLVT